MQKPGRKIPLEQFQALGYRYMVARGQKGYNGVAILSKLPIMDAGDQDFAHAGPCPPRLGAAGKRRHHPQLLCAGGRRHSRPRGEREIRPEAGFPDPDARPFRWDRPDRSILVGDLNIAPREDDVWDHKALLKIVSHTPIEVDHLGAGDGGGQLAGRHPRRHSAGPALQLVELPRPDWDAADKGRRLDHIWATPDISNAAHGSRILRAVRGWEQPSDHAPVFATFDL
jgi:exodeoxyribonuclease-3